MNVTELFVLVCFLWGGGIVAVFALGVLRDRARDRRERMFHARAMHPAGTARNREVVR